MDSLCLHLFNNGSSGIIVRNVKEAVKRKPAIISSVHSGTTALVKQTGFLIAVGHRIVIRDPPKSKVSSS